MAGEAALDAAALRAKQERIRDNQRRSRARRQEHLADLEKRLAESHSICREAEFQKSALKELQLENGRLRELLQLAGVDQKLVHAYVHQGGMSHQNDGGPNLRLLRPKLSADHSSTSPLVNAASSKETSHSPFSDMTFLDNVSSIEQDFSGISNAALFAPIPVYPEAGSFFPTDYTPSHSVRPEPSALPSAGMDMFKTEHDNSFLCDTFDTKPDGDVLTSPENTILCSVAKEMIEQYNIGTQDMQEVKTRLSAGFSKPTRSDQGCRVDSQLLFQVLNDISSKIS